MRKKRKTKKELLKNYQAETHEKVTSGSNQSQGSI